MKVIGGKVAQERSARRIGATWRSDLPCGHLPMPEAPDATAEAVCRFLAERS